MGAAFVYADLDMVGVFEKRLCPIKRLKDSIWVGTGQRVPHRVKQGYDQNIRRIMGLARLMPCFGGKCYDIVLFVVDGGK